jgi:hypothetical protein
MLFPVGLLLVNLQAMKYGNVVSASVPTAHDLPRVDLEQYLA